MTQNEKDYIKQITASNGWSAIVNIFKAEILESRKPLSFKTAGKSNEEIVRELCAREAAAKIVDKVLRKIELIGNEKINTPVVYK